MTAEEHISRARDQYRGVPVVTNDSALRHSAVWACLRLRANLISTMPVDVYRRVNKIQIEVPKPPVLVNPGGERVGMLEWMYSTQFDLDRGGNCFGIISEKDGMGLPRRIDLVPLSEVVVRVKDGKLKYRIGGKEFDPEQVWHEKQYTVAGLPVGLSPVAYAAWSIGEYLSVQDFALNWFGGEAIPAAHLKNTAKSLTSKQASDVKDIYKASVKDGGLFVTGNDWEYDMIQAEQAGADWIQAKQYGVADIARFFDCPGDLIDAMVSSSSITYASITQRNLQLLIMHVGPAVIRREDGLSRMLSRPRYVKLNTDALLRMDPKTRAEMLKVQIESRTVAPSEVRELDNREPFTDEQYAEFDRLFGVPKAKSAEEPAMAETTKE
jgi:HK97 family phage portal protein